MVDMHIERRAQLHSAATRQFFKQEYMAELLPFARAAARKDFRQLLAAFASYPEAARALVSGGDPYELLRRSSSATFKLEVGNTTPNVRTAFLLAQMAACCHLLHGSRLALDDLTFRRLRDLGEAFVDEALGSSDDYLQRIVAKFHNMDAIRVFQVLRVLGLVTRVSEQMLQIGLGSAHGTRDVLSVHAWPGMQIHDAQDGPVVEISATRREAAKTVIMDADPAYGEHYAELNENAALNVEACVGDALQSLVDLSRRSAVRYNLVTALRIDHRMITDVPAFLASLAGCIDDDCDFVLSIGAGDSLDDFCGRVRVVDALFDHLAEAGLRPVVFRLHEKGVPERQWKTLLYGNARASSYQIMYCRLSGSVLARHYG